MTYTDVFQLTDGISPISFSPDQGYNKPDDVSLLINNANDGSLYVYKKYSKRRWEIPLKMLEKASADQINSWRESLTLLSFYPDMINAPTASFVVRIINDTRPLSSMTEWTWEQLYDGNLILREV